jgi:hypothetical protein
LPHASAPPQLVRQRIVQVKSHKAEEASSTWQMAHWGKRHEGVRATLSRHTQTHTHYLFLLERIGGFNRAAGPPLTRLLYARKQSWPFFKFPFLFFFFFFSRMHILCSTAPSCYPDAQGSRSTQKDRNRKKKKKKKRQVSRAAYMLQLTEQHVPDEEIPDPTRTEAKKPPKKPP